MNKNTLIILGGALFVAIFAALLVQSGLSSGDKEEAVAEVQEKVLVLIASKDIPVGVEVTGSNMTWKEWPKETAFDAAILRKGDQSPSDAIKGRALRTIEAGEPITSASIVKETRGNFVAAALGPGMRGFAISVSAETAAGGFVLPGDYVDVILTHRVRIGNDDVAQAVAAPIVSSNAAETIVKAVKVLAIDQEATPTEDAKKARTITLEVTPKQSEVLALANAMGDLSVSLRKLGENELTGEKEVSETTTDNRTSKVLKEIQDATEQAPNLEDAQVRLYSGNQSSNVNVRLPAKGNN